MKLHADLIATPGRLERQQARGGVLRGRITAAPCQAGQIAYVGDRLDNDLKPAKAAGMRTIFIRHGPWGCSWEQHPDLPNAADWQVASLAELPPLTAVNQTEVLADLGRRVLTGPI